MNRKNKQMIIKLLNKIKWFVSKIFNSKDYILYQKAIGGNHRTVKIYEFNKLVKIKKEYIPPNTKAAKEWLNKYKGNLKRIEINKDKLINETYKVM